MMVMMVRLLVRMVVMVPMVIDVGMITVMIM